MITDRDRAARELIAFYHEAGVDAAVAPQDLFSIGAQRARGDIDGHRDFVTRQTAPAVAPAPES